MTRSQQTRENRSLNIGRMKSVRSVQASAALFGEIYSYLRRARQPGADLRELKLEWASAVLRRVGLNIEVAGEPTHSPTILFVGNHLSYLDIPLLMSLVPGLSFVAKAEVASWPLIGRGARAIDTIFVKRELAGRRLEARKAVAEGLRQGKRIAIFPSGTTDLREEKDWRRGAFEVAHQERALIQPFRLSYSPLRTAAYIGDDFLPTHLARLMVTADLRAKIEFHPPVPVLDPEADRRRWREWSNPRVFSFE